MFQTLTAPVLLSTLQSGMSLDSVTIQLLILSLRLLSTAERDEKPILDRRRVFISKLKLQLSSEC